MEQPPGGDPSIGADLAPTSALAAPSTPAVAPGAEEIPRPAKRPVGRPKGSKNKAKNPQLAVDSPQEKRPIGRPRGSGKKKAEPDSPESPVVKRPIGRPRKDGLPPGSAASSSKLSTLVPPSNYQANSNNVPPINQWVPFPGGVSAPPPPAAPAPVVDPALQHNEWAELAQTKPNDFLRVLLSSLSTLDPPASVSGPSVEEAFTRHLGSLAPPANSSAPNSTTGSMPPVQTIPSLYSILKTFWLPSSPSYFALTASTSARISAHRFLYWDPQPLVFNGIACPSCSSPLFNRGRIRSGPFTIYDISGPFFVIGCAYACANNHAYASTDAAVRRALPTALESEFPARLLDGDAGVGPDTWNWQPRGVSRALWNLVQAALRAGLPPDVILRLVRDVQHGVPEAVVIKEEETPAPAAHVGEQEEEESAEDAAEGQAPTTVAEDAIMAPPSESTEPQSASVASATHPQAFNDAWTTANTVVAGGDMNTNPYARLALALPLFAQAAQNPPVAGWDPTNLSRKRPYPFDTSDGVVGDGSSSNSPPAKTRNPRHCCKCGSQICKGKGGRSFCQSPCMDCGKMTCWGRNSRRPDKPCHEGWPPTAQPPMQMQDAGQTPDQALDGGVV
ncbi:hypothetical protein C8R46DRAFT_1228337 [Mycena filopes]|nr:hypothetical protein C8R46DRAFT_1228337 [Mycena filopes]